MLLSIEMEVSVNPAPLPVCRADAAKNRAGGGLNFGCQRKTPSTKEKSYHRVGVSPERAPLPITETGYRSHFTPRAAMDGYDSAEAFVEAWLDHESRSPEWKAFDQANKQLSLF